MRNWKQRLCSLLLCGAMLASLCPTALAEDVSIPYLDETGTEKFCETYRPATDSPWDGGWYVAQGNPEIPRRITVTGEVHLILANGCDLAAVYGIEVSEGNSLTIYAQSDDETMGTVTARGDFSGAGIGGGGNITINGGNVRAAGGYGGAGIGGGNITINGGTVNATSQNGAGIGGGNGGDGGQITISGGTVTATSEDYGAGIGGIGSGGGEITISGGEVTATGKSGAGIGGGGGSGDNSGDPVGGAGGNITISGGTVTATSNTGAGIGGGGGDRTASPGGAGGKIIISGGTVTATSESTGAGIGGGLNAAGGEIAISGGEVTATGNSGAGIGGGQRGNGGEIAINGGTVTVQSSKGADIGGGNSTGDGIAPSDKIEISGGTVTRPGGNPPNVGSATHQATDEWASDGTHHWHPCEAADCDKNHQFNKDTHTPSDWIVDQAATATTAGSRHRVCGDCQYQETQAIPATGGGSSGGSSGGGGYVPPTYRPDVTQPSQGGSVSVSPSSPQRGDTVTVTPRPDEGYALDSITVTDRDGKGVELTAGPDGTYTFRQPSGRVKIEVAFKPIETPWNNPFSDVSQDDWYYEAVRFAKEQGLMNGYSDGRFGAEDTLSRSQLAQILFNKEGRPGVNYLPEFSDMAGGAWYTEAVRWAASQGIVGGYGDGTFGPNAPITREQLAVMLWRYSGSPAASSTELDFNDEGQISGYALEALRWAVESGVLNGDGGGRLDPQGQATRAQVAQILKNFLEEENT